MKIGIIGSGGVAKTLAVGFLKHGYEVMLGSRTPERLADWKNANPGAVLGSVSECAKFAEVVVLAVKGTASVAAMRAVPAQAIRDKTVIDATNPIEDTPPVNGVLRFFTPQNSSLMEQLQSEFAGANFVKAFNSVGAPRMVDPVYQGGKPTMFICGNKQAAKDEVSTILADFGWESADMGSAEAARAIEALCMLWCIPGFLHGQFSHAFKLLL